MDFWISKWISDFRMDFWISKWISDFRMDFWISKWISGFQSGFLDFKADFWISKWISRGISGFQSRFLEGFLDLSEFLDFKADFWISFEPLLLKIQLKYTHDSSTAFLSVCMLTEYKVTVLHRYIAHRQRVR